MFFFQHIQSGCFKFSRLSNRSLGEPSLLLFLHKKSTRELFFSHSIISPVTMIRSSEKKERKKRRQGALTFGLAAASKFDTARVAMNSRSYSITETRYNIHGARLVLFRSDAIFVFCVYVCVCVCRCTRMFRQRGWWRVFDGNRV